jgi:hypothetical protein
VIELHRRRPVACLVAVAATQAAKARPYFPFARFRAVRIQFRRLLSSNGLGR